MKDKLTVSWLCMIAPATFLAASLGLAGTTLSHASPSPTPVPSPAKARIVFIDSEIRDYRQLVGAISPGMQVVVLNREGDEFAQITAALANRDDARHPISSVYIVSHGEPGALWLGHRRITSEVLQAHAAELQQWRLALAPDADILLYGCRLAENQSGLDLIERLADLTGSRVAASTDYTGTAKLGGNWCLEAQTGSLHSPGPFRAGLNYDGLLAVSKTFNPPPQVFVRPGGTSYSWNFSTGTTPDPNYPGSYAVTSVGYYNVPAFNWVVTRGHFEYSSNGGSTWTTYTMSTSPTYIANSGTLWRFVDTAPADTSTVNSFGFSWKLQGPPSSVQTGSSVNPDNPPTGITSDRATLFATLATGAKVATLTPTDTGSTLNGYWAIDSQSVPNLFTLTFDATKGNTAILALGSGTIPAIGQTATVTARYYDLYQTDASGNPISGQGFSKTLTFTVVSEVSADLNFGGDLSVNTYTNNDQNHAAVATLSDGNFVTVWQSAGQNGKNLTPSVNHGIYGQIYSSTGAKVGGEFVISSGGSAVDEITPAVTPLNNGRFAVAYCTAGADYDVAFRIVEANGTVGAQHIANTTTAENQYNPFMATLTDGSFVIIWSSDNGDVKLQQFGAAGGATVGSETTIVSAGGFNPGVTALDNGGYATTWVDYNTYDVMIKAGGGSAVDTGIYWSGYGGPPRVAGLAGGFVVASEYYDTATDLSQIKAARYNNAGVAQGGAFQVNSHTSGNRFSTSLAKLSGGGFLVAWISDTDDFDLNGIFGRRYAANGLPVDNTEFEINQHRLDDQSLVAVTALANDAFAAAWTTISAASIADSTYIGDVKARVLLPANLAPTDLALSAASVNQSAGVNATVGALSSTDADSATFTYSLVAGTGSTDNGAFNISGSTLRANNAAALSAGNHSVRLQTDDGSGGTFAKAFTISVMDDIAPAAPASFSAIATGSNLALSWSNPTNADFASITIRRSSVSYPATIADGTLVAQGVTGTSNPDNGLPDGTYYYSLFAVDGAGNVSAAATVSVIVDATAPTVAISAPSTNITTSGPISFTVTWSDANLNPSSISLQANQVIVNATGTANVNSVSVSGSGTTRTVQLDAISGDGTVGISILANTGSDLAGNPAGAAGPSATTIVDNTAPTLSVGSPSASSTATGPVSYTITYTAADAVTLTDSHVTLNKTGSANGTVGVSGSGTSERTVTISNITGSGTLGISLAAGTANDTAGNLAAAAGPSTTFSVNAAPVAGADSVARLNNTKVAKVAKALLLSNDTDADSDPLAITAVGNALPAGATVAMAGAFVIYTAPSTNAGDGSFTYTLSDGPGGHTVMAAVPVIEIASAPSGAGPNFAQIVTSSGNYEITFIGVPGKLYRVQYSTSLSAPYVWNEFSPLAIFTAPTNGVFTFTDVNPPDPMRLYRAVPHP